MLLVLRIAVHKHGKTPTRHDHNEMGHLFPWQEWREDWQQDHELAMVISIHQECLRARSLADKKR